MRLFLLFLVAVVCAPAVFGQDEDVRRYEFYGGYAYQRVVDTPRNVPFADGIAVLNARDQNYHGFTGEFNQNLTRHWGLVTSFTGVYDKTPWSTAITGTPLKANASRYDLMFGPRYNFRLGRINPFAEAMAGFEHLHVDFTNQTNGNSAKVSDTAFAMAFGGGLDVRLNNRFDVRAIQADYIPTFFNSSHQNNYRLGAGLKVKVGPDP